MSQLNPNKIALIIHDCGGTVIGRTRLQKIAYLLEAAGLEEGFPFVYKHYGPFSEELASSARLASLLGVVRESESPASWGGTFSTYVVMQKIDSVSSQERIRFARFAASADAVELELAATAVFLAKEGYPDAWFETARRKPEKVVGGRLERAKSLYSKFLTIPTPTALPQL